MNMKKKIFCLTFGVFLLISIFFFGQQLIFNNNSIKQNNNTSIQKQNKITIKKYDGFNIGIFYTGELLGSLEPCGCSGEKTGGLIIRSAWIHQIKKKLKNLILVDGGFGLEKSNEQEKLKCAVHNKVLKILNYDYQFVGSNDNLVPNISKKSLLIGHNYTAASWYSYKKITDGKNQQKILFVTIERDKKPPKKELTEIIQKFSPDVVFLMTKKIYSGYQFLIPEGNYLTIILPVDAQAPFSPLKPKPNILVISAGNQGRYAGLMTLNFKNGKLSKWENTPIVLTKGYKANPKVESEILKYKLMIKKKNFLLFRIKKISPIGFIGTKNCIECHKEEYKKWTTKKHAHAFETLRKVHSEYDPECVGCHVVGFDYEEGFESPETTPELIDVGCEVCHGPGARHLVNSDLPGYGKTSKEKICLTCHTHERSPDFEYKKFSEKIKHWKD